MMHRTPNTNQELRSRTSNATRVKTVFAMELEEIENVNEPARDTIEPNGKKN